MKSYCLFILMLVNLSVCSVAEEVSKKTKSSMPTVLVTSYNTKKTYLIDPEGAIIWQRRMPGACLDSWKLNNGNFLISGGNKVCEVTPKGKEVWGYTSPKGVKTEINTCQPLPDGRVMIAESGTCRIVELNQGKIVKEVKLKIRGNAHSQMRIARKTTKGTYVVCCMHEHTVREFNDKGKCIQVITAEMMKKQGVKWDHVHGIVCLDNGNWLVSGGYTGHLAEIDKNNKVVWTLKPEDVPGLGFSFVAGCSRLKDGTTVVTGYRSRYPLFAVDKNKKVLWKYPSPKSGRLTHVQVLGDTGKGSNR